MGNSTLDVEGVEGVLCCGQVRRQQVRVDVWFLVLAICHGSFGSSRIYRRHGLVDVIHFEVLEQLENGVGSVKVIIDWKRSSSANGGPTRRTSYMDSKKCRDGGNVPIFTKYQEFIIPSMRTRLGLPAS